MTPALLRELDTLALQKLPIAEINRRVGARASELGLVRPSYHRVRQLVNEIRDRAPQEPSWRELAVDVALRIRPPDVLVDKMAGTLPMPEDAGIDRLH